MIIGWLVVYFIGESLYLLLYTVTFYTNIFYTDTFYTGIFYTNTFYTDVFYTCIFYTDTFSTDIFYTSSSLAVRLADDDCSMFWSSNYGFPDELQPAKYQD